ncbi:MAG: TauD/TfdA family dioxygenase [Cyanobacteria bacterium P01_F01_bin.150]
MIINDSKRISSSSERQPYHSITLKQGQGCTANLIDDFVDSLAELPHPWHIEVPDRYADDPDVYQCLVDLHTRGDICLGDRITGAKRSCLTNVSYIAKIFAGEYDTSEFESVDGQIQQTLTRVPIILNGNIHPQMPESIEDLATELKKHGHILVRSGTSVDEQQILALLGNGQAMDYRYGNAARTQVKDSNSLKVTAWPKELMLPAHNEMTYHLEFPNHLVFLCKEPSEFGGETSIYDCAEAFKALSPAMQQKVTHHDVVCCKRYVKAVNHSCYPSWQQVLGEGTSCEEIIQHFVSIGYQCQQLQEEEQDGTMTTVVETRLLRPMVYQYHDEPCLHSSMVPLVPYWYGQLWPDQVPPLIAIWDNGEPITPAEFHELHDAMLVARIRYGGWQKHDVLILDNPRVAHGRLPFIGNRVIGVLMTQPTSFTLADKQWQVAYS